MKKLSVEKIDELARSSQLPYADIEIMIQKYKWGKFQLNKLEQLVKALKLLEQGIPFNEQY